MHFSRRFLPLFLLHKYAFIMSRMPIEVYNELRQLPGNNVSFFPGW